MVEASRRHGPFDLRYPVRLKLAATAWEPQPDEGGMERLDWSPFLARFFPNSHRHDFDALAAYESYRNALDHASLVAGSRPEYMREGALEASESAGVAPLPAALLAWEWEGGALATRVAG